MCHKGPGVSPAQLNGQRHMPLDTRVALGRREAARLKGEVGDKLEFPLPPLISFLPILDLPLSINLCYFILGILKISS